MSPKCRPNDRGRDRMSPAFSAMLLPTRTPVLVLLASSSHQTMCRGKEGVPFFCESAGEEHIMAKHPRPNTHLRNARLQRGLTQERLAEIVGVEPKTVQRWEGGQSTPRPYALQRLREQLQSTPAELGWPDADEHHEEEQSSGAEDSSPKKAGCSFCLLFFLLAGGLLPILVLILTGMIAMP